MTKKTIKQAIEDKLPSGMEFKLSKEVYEKTGVNHKRFGMILSGKIDPTVSEFKSICNYFNINILDIL